LGGNAFMKLKKSSFKTFLGRWAKWLTGLAFIGFSIAFMKHANLGLGPWDVLNDSLAGLTGIRLGTVSIVVGALVLLLWIPMREKPGVTLIPNILLIGAFTNAGMALVESASSAFLRSAWLITGLLLASLGSALYLGSQLGAGPRDGLMLGLSRKTGWSVRRTRTALEVFVLLIGWALGGTVGIGTVISALTIGPAIQLMAGKAGEEIESRGGQGMNDETRRGTQVETLAWTGGNTVVTCHQSG
jgi:uncharacterized membrane protein YczE